MTERDKADFEVVERWNAAQAARAMAAAAEDHAGQDDRVPEPSTPDFARYPRRARRLAAAVALAGAIAAYFLLRTAFFANAGGRSALASGSPDAQAPSPGPTPHIGPSEPGQRSPPVQWTRDAGGNGHWYQIVSLGRDLGGRDGPPIQGVLGVEGAIRAARDSGAYLVTIHSQAEQDFVHALVAAQYPRYLGFRIITGGVRAGSGYAWRNGEPFDFDLFSTSHPVHPPGSPIVIGTGPDNPWCPANATGCWMTFPADQAWAFHVAVVEWNERFAR